MVTITELAHKFVFLAKRYPDHDLQKLIQLFEMAPIDINAAIWRAKEMEMVTIKDKEGLITLHPEKIAEYKFGPEVDVIKDRLLYALKKMNENEGDMEEFVLSQWFRGYGAHDLLIGLWNLIDDGKIAMYSVKENKNDEESSTYVFYTLIENLGKEFGRKQFKDPKKTIVVPNS